MPAVLFFATITLAVTLIHLSRFHLHSVFGIAWVAVYVGFPPAMAAILADQLRRVCATTARSTRLPALTRTVLILQAVVMASLGIALLVAPGHAAPLWPWPLTALTGQAIGAWLAGVAFLAAHIVWEDSCERADVAMLSYATFGVLQLVALARYPSSPNWGPAARRLPHLPGWHDRRRRRDLDQRPPSDKRVDIRTPRPISHTPPCDGAARVCGPCSPRARGLDSSMSSQRLARLKATECCYRPVALAPVGSIERSEGG